MASKTHVTFFGIRIGRFLFLLISIILMMGVHPLLKGIIHLRILTDILFTAILISGLWAFSRRRMVFMTGLLAAIPSLALGWVIYFVEAPSLGLMSRFFLALFLIVMLAALLTHILKAREVTIDLIMGAASTYFLIGFLWAFIYFFIETLSPGSFRLAEGPSADLERQLLYYSFITLTTVGYGDITPVSILARSYAALEAVIGQLYLAVLVAGLVGLRISQATERKG